MNVYFVSGIDTDIGKTVAVGMMARDLHRRGVRVITMKLVQILRCKNFTDKSHVFIISDITILTDCDATAFLSAMLQSEEPVVNRGSYIFARKIINTENPALLSQLVGDLLLLMNFTMFHLYSLLSYFTNSAPVRSVPWEGTLLAADAADVI